MRSSNTSLFLQVDEIAAGAGPSGTGLDFSGNETWNRLNADPMLLMKRNEVNKVKAKTSNPYLVQQLKEQMREVSELRRLCLSLATARRILDESKSTDETD